MLAAGHHWKHGVCARFRVFSEFVDGNFVSVSVWAFEWESGHCQIVFGSNQQLKESRKSVQLDCNCMGSRLRLIGGLQKLFV